MKLFGVAVERGDGGDVRLLTGVGLVLCCLAGLVRAARNDLGIGLVPELVPQAQGHSPVRHGALRIVLRDFQELLLRLLIPERVQQCDSALEGLLRRGLAGNREVNRAQFGGGQVFVVMLVLVVGGRERKYEKSSEQGQTDEMFHEDLAERRV